MKRPAFYIDASIFHCALGADAKSTSNPFLRFCISLLLIVAISLTIPDRYIQAATISQLSDFEDGTLQGWGFGAPPPPALAPKVIDTGGIDGDGDAFMLLTSSGNFGVGSRLAILNDTNDWSGDYAAAGVASIELDMMNPVDSAELEMRLVMFSSGDRWTSLDSQVVPNDGLWRHYSFPISSEDITIVSNCCGRDFDFLISNVDQVMFRHDSGGPSSQGTRIQATLGLDNITLAPEILSIPLLNGRGETYFENFDAMETTTAAPPAGWTGETNVGLRTRIDSLGLVDGPLDGVDASAFGLLNVGGNVERFEGRDGRVPTWQADLNRDRTLDDGDVVIDAAEDRALAVTRLENNDTGRLNLSLEIVEAPLRAFTYSWDLEVWGGDPDAANRGSDGGGFSVDVTVGGVDYLIDQISSLRPGTLFTSNFDGDSMSKNPTLINGNEHSIRGNLSGIVEVDAVDGAIGNIVNFTLDAHHDDSDVGWITAVDNVQFRALAAGDAQGDGDVDPGDLIQLLGGGAFGQGNIDASWAQGDFDNDGDFDGTDILAIVQALAGEFPKVYAAEIGMPNDSVPDVIINPATGNITVDTNDIKIGSIVIDSAAGIFNGPNSPSWDAPGDFAADIDTQISMPISFTDPGYSGVDDLGDGIIGTLSADFDYLADLTIKYLDPNGDLLDGNAIVVPEPGSFILILIGSLGLLCRFFRTKKNIS